ncbi:hypothetical protein CAPTEDRAFT_207260 [Capitella teleta]|uniref:F5/8 type C domain-containing protein n=1 Tax=Capitella teleta TaxID=283909 RepID=R7UN31_CAPTE|nr:hypothetical protein CAPTEDRAFT_207260 [Capitella teleta]|eukprot:ELU07949.1 hypothetical protein CAPTEDRAFT_207260 [Capitella teleta]
MTLIVDEIDWNDTPPSVLPESNQPLKNHSGKADSLLNCNIQKPPGARTTLYIDIVINTTRGMIGLHGSAQPIRVYGTETLTTVVQDGINRCIDTNLEQGSEAANSDDTRLISDNESHSTTNDRRIMKEDIAVVTKVLFLVLSLTHGLIGVHTFCQCIGYEPLIINASSSQLSASTIFSSRHSAHASKWTEIGWATAYNKKEGSWIEVDLLENKLIGGIVTWGRGSNDVVQYVQTFNVDYRIEGSNDWITYADTTGSIVNCIHATSDRILLNYKGLITPFNSTNLVLSGDSLPCNNKSMTIGIEIGMIGCAVEYNTCEMNDENGDGKCHVLCELKVWQDNRNMKETKVLAFGQKPLCLHTFARDDVPRQTFLPPRLPDLSRQILISDSVDRSQVDKVTLMGKAWQFRWPVGFQTLARS